MMTNGDLSLMGWDGRSWIETSDVFEKPRIALKCLSYHVLADTKCKQLVYTTTRNWDTRREVLIQEISAYGADIIMLQDVDHFTEWWRPKLLLIGYDSVFFKRTDRRESHDEGVLIGYKRLNFQLFKTVFVELNDSADNEMEKGSVYREKCRTDDVGLIAFIQPFSGVDFPSAICVGSVMISDKEEYDDVRSTQIQHFCRELEIANKDFQLPVVVGVSMFDSPSSGAYHVMRTGRLPMTAQAPRKMHIRPTGCATCRGSVKLKW